MKRLTLLAGVTLLALTGSPALAACMDEITALSPGTTSGSTMPGTTGSVSPSGIAKDGNTAPLQPAPGAASGATQNPGMATSQQAQNSGSPGQPQGIAKDGSTMPMANQPGGGNTTVATSQQDVQNQQRGGQTAANQAEQSQGGASTSGNRSPQMMAALDRARMMQQQGNEAGCMQAIQETKRLQQ